MDLQEWENRLRQDLAALQSSGYQLATKVATVRGRAEANGVRVEVDADGNITDLQIASGAMQWTSSRLTATLLDCHRNARADARAQIENLAAKSDPHIRDQLQRARKIPDPQRHLDSQQMTEDEIQAADDAYFHNRNRYGGWNDRR
ncbi:YbaB/EbfC family DNA-binding protein [Nocardia panacis]|uniref:YbaB/EbfC family DNA-binding protein n=1 Tax=Nocardia panacis TaxID=2340916 RepID=A0A3A4KB16_9NOCA|nr:YbaB/EbfC family nucleoid-associated protein [Nocardia panacis]RJO70620.1 YbaB/EbfC family DNA-binding protein [Nocardia panacis]